MKKITIAAYKYRELGEKAKAKANALVNDECFWYTDICASYSAVYEHVANMIRNEKTFDEIREELEAKKEECAFTGYCADCDAVEDALDCMTKDEDGCPYFPANRFKIFKDAAIETEFGYQCNDENTAEHCEANGYLFDVYGNFVHHLEEK